MVFLHAAAVTAEGEVPLEWSSGSNGYVYFVCNYLGGPLTQLPHVTPQQVGSLAAVTIVQQQQPLANTLASSPWAQHHTLSGALRFGSSRNPSSSALLSQQRLAAVTSCPSSALLMLLITVLLYRRSRPHAASSAS